MLKEKVRTKILQRTPQEGLLHKDESRPFVIVIINIFNEKKSSLPGWAETKLENLTRKVTINFTKDTQIELGERESFDKLLEEMDLNLSVLPWNNPADANLFGKFLYARAMLFLDICAESEGLFPSKEIFLYYRLVDVETGIVKYAEDDLKLYKKAVISDLAEKIHQRLQKLIYKTYSLSDN